MGVIVFLNIFVIICSYLAKYNNYRSFFAIGFYVLTLVLALRYGYGNDYFNYFDVFQESQTNSFTNVDTDWGWYFLCRLFKPVGFKGFVVFHTILAQSLVYRFIRRHVEPKWYWFAMTIYLFQPNFMLLGCSMMRQFLAMVILLNALDAIVERKLLISFLIVLLAASIHKIAFIFIPFVFLDYLKICFKNKWFYVGVLVLLFLVSRFQETILVGLATYMLDSQTDFTSYFYSQDEGKIGIREIFLMSYFAFLMIRNYDKLSVTNQLSSILTLASVFVLPFATMVVMLRRVMYIFMLFQVSSFPSVVNSERNNLYKISFVACFILFTLIDFVRFFHGETYGEYYMEFKTIFQAL